MKNQSRKTIELGSKRVPLKKLLHNKEIREAAKALEEFRLNFNEQEILHGGRITLKVGTYGEVTAVVKRPETDNEYNERLEKARLAAIAKAEREEKARANKAQQAIVAAAQKKERTAEYIKKLAAEAGLEVDILDK